MFINKNISKKTLLQALNYEISLTERRILDYMLLFSIKNNLNYVSQWRIAMFLKLSVRTVNRCIKKFFDMGIIVFKKQRGFNKSNQYTFNSLIFSFKEYLYQILPSLKWCKKALHKPKPYTDVVLCLQGRLLINNLFKTMLVRGPKKVGDMFTGVSKTIKNNFYRRIEEKKEEFPLRHGEIVMQRSNPILSPTILRISKALNLTEYGQLKLLVVPERALVATFEEYLRCKDTPRVSTNPFLWFLHYAKGYCLQNNIDADWNLWDSIKKAYNVPDNPQWVHKPIVNSIQNNHSPEVKFNKEKDFVFISSAYQAKMDMMEPDEKERFKRNLKDFLSMMPEEAQEVWKTKNMMLIN